MLFHKYKSIILDFLARLPSSRQVESMRIAIAGDSAGVSLVDVLASYLSNCEGIEVSDLSRPPSGTAEFYANVADRVANAILAKEFDRGILVCGTGIGMAICANKVPGIRAALTHDTFSAERAAKSNNAHIITLGARVIGTELAKTIVNAWLASEFDPAGASAANVAAIDELDRKYRK
jgi:ribose 5-phosphate isomerase B